MTRTILAALLAILATASAAPAQQPRSFQFVFENDLQGGDRTYTDGLRFTWSFPRPETEPDFMGTFVTRTNRGIAKRLSGIRFFGIDAVEGMFDGVTEGQHAQSAEACSGVHLSRVFRPCRVVSYSLAQTMYTPTNLVETALQPDDRPFAAFLHASRTETVVIGRGQLTTELQVGFTGPPALGKESQRMAHWALVAKSPRTMGWDNQLDFVPHLNLIQTVSGHLFEWCREGECDGTQEEGRVFDLSPRVELVAGTLMTRAAAGVTVRAGYRFPDILGLQSIPVTVGRLAAAPDSAERMDGNATRASGWCRTCWGNFFASADARYVHHNALISGSPLVDRGPDDWRTNEQIDTRAWVPEGSIGFSFGWEAFTMTGRMMWRGAEFSPNDETHRILQLQLSHHR